MGSGCSKASEAFEGNVIAVGYRVNSFEATQLRIWATKTLREFMPDGGRLFTDEMLERATVKRDWTVPDDGEWMRPKGVTSWLRESEIELNRMPGDRVSAERIKP